MANFNRFIFSLILLFIFSCKTEHSQNIDSHLLKSVFIDSNSTFESTNNQVFDCEFMRDTIKRKEQYEDAINQLLNKFNEIDTFATNTETKQYAKSMLLAEWVYGHFYFQFLGPELGFSETTKSNVDFKHSDIKSCYNAGVSGEMAVWCEDRTAIFTRLIDSLLHLKTAVISFNPIHIFPLVTIGKHSYIIDPYDPFLIFDEEQQIIDYNTLQHKLSGLQAIRTKRNFGQSGDLISKKLYHLMSKNYPIENKDIGAMISEYLSKNKIKLTIHVDSCSVESFAMTRKAFPIKSYTNELVLYTPQNILNPVIKKTRIMRYYLGKDCKTIN